MIPTTCTRQAKAGTKTFVPEDIDGKVVSIRFEGVYMDSTVFVNGRKVGD